MKPALLHAPCDVRRSRKRAARYLATHEALEADVERNRRAMEAMAMDLEAFIDWQACDPEFLATGGIAPVLAGNRMREAG